MSSKPVKPEGKGDPDSKAWLNLPAWSGSSSFRPKSEVNPKPEVKHKLEAKPRVGATPTHVKPAPSADSLQDVPKYRANAQKRAVAEFVRVAAPRPHRNGGRRPAHAPFKGLCFECEFRFGRTYFLHDRGVIGALNRAARYLRMRRGGAGKVFYFLDNIEWSIDADVQLELSKVADTSLIWVRVPGTRISVTCANATATLVKQEQNSLPPNAGFPNAPSSQQVFSGGQTAHAQQPQLPHQSEGVPNQRAIVTMGPTGPPQVQGSHPAIECLQS